MIAYPVALVSAIPEKDIAYDNIAFLLFLAGKTFIEYKIGKGNRKIVHPLILEIMNCNHWNNAGNF